MVVELLNPLRLHATDGRLLHDLPAGGRFNGTTQYDGAYGIWAPNGIIVIGADRCRVVNHQPSEELCEEEFPPEEEALL